MAEAAMIADPPGAGMPVDGTPADAGLAARRPAPSAPEIALVGIYEISKILTVPDRLEITLANVVNVLTSFLQMRRGMIVVLDEIGDPEIVATAGWAGEVKGRAIDSLPQAVIDRIVATMTPLVVPDVAAEPLFAPARAMLDGRDGRVSFLGVPVKADARVIGTLSIDRVWDGRTQFRLDDDLRFLAMVANLVGQTVRLHRILSADRLRLIEERRRVEKTLGDELAGGRRRAPAPRPKIEGIVGESRALKAVLDTVAVVARSNSTVLLRGESGTGKELFARAIHDLSPRKDKAFVKLNCAALPESVLESELFGHEKGAFTGAMAQRSGRFELAHGGTLLLDEIGEISPAFQAKLLRVLQEGEFERVGGNRTLKVDVRLICATNRNLEEAVAKGEFRADLYYRINVVPVFLPPLRERPGDIPHLARAFLERFNSENDCTLALSESGIDLLARCYFPGNVRELENCIRRTATLARHDVIVRDDFACVTGQCLSAMLWTGGHRADPIAALAAGGTIVPAGAARPALVRPGTEGAAPSYGGPSPEGAVPAAMGGAGPPMADVSPQAGGAVSAGGGGAAGASAAGAAAGERERLVAAMERCGWVQAKAARILGLTPRQIGYALRKHGIELKRF